MNVDVERNAVDFDCDVAVIGGGPAGATAATYLAKEGFSVHVFEKERFPRFHIGESLLPYNTPIFEEMGVLQKIESAGFLRKNGAQFHLGDGSRRTKFRFRDGSFTEHPSAFQVERSRFDEILLNHAQSCGARVSQETLVTGFDVRPEVGITVRWRSDDRSGEEQTRARFLMDASGVVNFSGNREKLREDHPKLRKVAVWGHFSRVDMPGGSESGDIVIVRLRDAWTWLIPLSEEKVSVGIVFEKTVLKGVNPQSLFAQTVAEHPELEKRLGSAEAVSDLFTITDFSYANRDIVSPRLVRIGDAAGFLDPIFSSGVYLAMAGARTAAAAVAEALRSGDGMTARLRRYEGRCRRNMQLYQEIIEGFYTPDMMEVLMAPRRFFQVPDAVNAILAGRLDGSWAVRWRLRLFYLLVKLQKRRGFLPRIPSLR